MTGRLSKKSPSLLKGWQERLGVLKDRKLSYYKGSVDTLPRGVINFDLFQCEVERSQQKPTDFVLKLTNSNRIFEFRCPTEQERNRWVNALNEHIKDSAGHKIKRNLNVNKPWKFDTISES